MDISVEELSSVDKAITITADREDLKPQIDKALKKYRKQINMPGFRPGKVPLSIVRKRFGDEIEAEEVNKYIQNVFEKEIVPEYDPVGETQMMDFSWEDGELEAKFKIGTKPEFELADLSSVTVDKMVHDVADDEVDEEIERILENQGEWEESEGDVSETSKVVIDAVALDEEGNEIEDDKEEGQELDLREEENKAFLEALKGSKAGDTVEVDLGEGDEEEKYSISINKVLELNEAELTDEFAQQQTDGEAETVDEYRSLVKSRIQDYFDQVSDDIVKNELVDALVGAHDFEVPEVFIEQILNQYVEQAKQQAGGSLPEGFHEQSYKHSMKDRAMTDAKWMFINNKLQEKFDDIEIKPEDVDEHLATEAARYGMTADQLKNIYAQNADQLERLRSSIRENKVFDRLMEEVSFNEISREEYQEKQQAQQEEEEAKVSDQEE
ncbi:MAG: trigger factor [Bacteroidota bacterium]